MNTFADSLRHWRRTRHLSQLALAGETDISARHLAFLETGRARPSRAMVLRLAAALGLPNGETNGLLQHAGFSAQYPARPLEADEMATVRDAMLWTISRHAPYPALVMDRLWRITALNDPATRLFGALGIGVGTSLLAVIDGSVPPSEFIENWGEVGRHTLQRLRTESARGGGIPDLDRTIARLARDPDVARTPEPGDSAVIPTIYRAGGLRLALFSTYAQFGSAAEVALADMKIELMFPADEATKSALLALS